MKELREIVDAYDGRVLVGEEDDIAYYGSGDDELHMVFNFPLMRVEGVLTPAHIRENQAERIAAMPEISWPANTLGNHDSPRVKSRYGDGEHDDALARLSLALMLSLRGTPFLYNGEEIGMTDTTFDSLDQLKDTLALRRYEVAVAAGMPEEQARALVCRNTRDRCRTPVQWADAPNGGFSPPSVTTWLPVNPNYAEGVNVADQLGDPDSMLTFYKTMLAVRKRTPALIAGDYTPLLEDHEDCLVFLRSTDAQTCLVALNFSEEAQSLAFEDIRLKGLVFSSEARGASAEKVADPGRTGALELAPFEIYIAEVAARR
jgi:alpha-glucosidase